MKKRVHKISDEEARIRWLRFRHILDLRKIQLAEFAAQVGAEGVQRNTVRNVFLRQAGSQNVEHAVAAFIGCPVEEFWPERDHCDNTIVPDNAEEVKNIDGR